MAANGGAKLCDYGSSGESNADDHESSGHQSSSDDVIEAPDASSELSSINKSKSNQDSGDKSKKVSKHSRQYRRGHRSSSRERSLSRRSGRRNRRSRSRSHRRHRRSHRERDHSHRSRRDRRRRHRSRSRDDSHRGHRRRDGRKHRSSSSSSSSSADSRRNRRSSRRDRKGDAIFSRKVVDSRSELANTKESLKPVDPVAARMEAANKASAIMAATTRSGQNTPQDVLARIQETQMAQLRANAEAAAAAANIPKYYNPLSVNAAKLAEQQQKRKLLWSRKHDPSTEAKEEAKSTMWKTTSMVAGKGDSAAAAKFRKLMGIHDDDGGAASSEALNQAQEQANLFRQLEREYETSRTLTHTQRGVGLGYSSAMAEYSAAYAAVRNNGSGNQTSN